MYSVCWVYAPEFDSRQRCIGRHTARVRGIEVNEKTLGFDDLAQVCLGDKGTLGSDHTLAVMQSVTYTRVGNWFSPTVWEASDKPLAIDNAIRTRDHILATYVPTHIRPRSTPRSAPSSRFV